MSDLALAVLGVLLFPLTFAAMWWAITRVLAWLSGWPRLATRYAWHGAPPPRGHTWVSGGIGPVSYRGVLCVGADAEALYLDVPDLFRAGQPPLRVPWADVRVRWAWWGGAVVDLGGLGTLRLWRSTWLEVTGDGGAATPTPPP